MLRTGNRTLSQIIRHYICLVSISLELVDLYISKLQFSCNKSSSSLSQDRISRIMSEMSNFILPTYSSNCCKRQPSRSGPKGLLFPWSNTGSSPHCLAACVNDETAWRLVSTDVQLTEIQLWVPEYFWRAQRSCLPDRPWWPAVLPNYPGVWVVQLQHSDIPWTRYVILQSSSTHVGLSNNHYRTVVVLFPAPRLDLPSE